VSGHFFILEAPITSINSTALTKIIITASGQLLQSSAIETLDLLQLPSGTNTSHIMPTFTNNLVSVGKFCGVGCTVTFIKAKVTLQDTTDNLILGGTREPTRARMWWFNLIQREDSNSVNNTFEATTQRPTHIPMEDEGQPWEAINVPPMALRAPARMIIPMNKDELTRPAAEAPSKA
jgi:hypothetical protein